MESFGEATSEKTFLSLHLEKENFLYNYFGHQVLL